MCIVSVHCLESGLLEVLGPPSKAFSWRIFLWVDFHFGLNASAVVGTKHVSVMQATLSNEQDRGAEEEGKGLLRYLKLSGTTRDPVSLVMTD